ncbi:MAG TPA: hypothetical protein DE313_01435 [Ruminococcus sp.]|nr:hypothetical protein [Ruminococcus sp.]
MADRIKKEEFKENSRGKKPNQKLKPYLVLKFLEKYSDEEHTFDGEAIANAMIEDYGIFAEKRSVYRDIKDINKAYIMQRDDVDVHKAEEILSKGYDEDKVILYNAAKKGYYWQDRKYTTEDLQLLAECINSAKFLSKKASEKLINIIEEDLSVSQKETLNTDVFLIDRIKSNKNIIYDISKINAAMSTKLDGIPHTPKKISFYYQKYSISNVREQIDRRKGETYIVSPFRLIINDGNYYLLGYSDKFKKMRTYRVDRMKGLEILDSDREGEEIYKKIDIKDFIERKFSMFDGTVEKVKIQFTKDLLDSFIDRFGSNKVYGIVDSNHYYISTFIEVSPPFFGWLCGFGNKVKIIEPLNVVNQFQKHLQKIIEKYK